MHGRHLPRYHDRRELWADGLVHVVGLALVVAGIVAMSIYLLPQADAALAAAAKIYLGCLLTVFTLSAVYNIWPQSLFKKSFSQNASVKTLSIKHLLRRFDHAAIYLLIAGTYTPFLVQAGEDTLWLLIFIWGTAAAGITLKLLFPERFEALSIVLYLLMGWSGVLMYGAIAQALSMRVMILIALGGVIYSVGVIFHLWRGLRYQNAIWHCFVLAGAACHYNAVMATMQAHAYPAMVTML